MPATSLTSATLLAGMLLSATTIAAPAALTAGLSADYSYAELADLTLAARLVVAADIVRATPLKGAAAIDVAPGRTRYYVEATTRALIGGAGPLPATVRYLVDLPTTLPRRQLKNAPVLLLAVPAERSGDIRLVSPRAQVARTPENETRVRTILTAALAPDAPPAITGIGHAFHVAGSLPGEGETQIFLKTVGDRPISLSILRRPGEAPRWAVALSELVDASAAPPAADSLLHYRLACGLPRLLPDSALAGLAAADAEQARADYGLVLEALGPCGKPDAS